jgi:hypothetical protein
MGNPGPASALLTAIFLLCVPIYLVVGVPFCLWQGRLRARQERLTNRWMWGTASVLVAGPVLLLGLLVAYDLGTNPASTQLTLLVFCIPLVPVLIWTAHWWIRTVSGWRWPSRR